MAAAVPFAIKAGTMFGGSLLGKLFSGGTKQQNAAVAGQQNAAGQLSGMVPGLMSQGSALTRQGAGYLGNAGDYYSKILSNRYAANQSLAPEMSTALDFYKGAAQNATRSLRGGSRDYALAELNRQKVGQLASYLPQARASAAQGAAGVGGQALAGGNAAQGLGVYAGSNAAQINSGLFGNATTLRNQEAEGGKQWGGMLYDLANVLFKPKAKAPPTGPGGMPTTVPYMPWTLAGGTA